MAVEQVAELLVLVRSHEDPTTEPEHHHEQMYFDPQLAEPDRDHAPIDLCLFARVGLKPRRCLLGLRRLAQWSDVPQHRHIRTFIARALQLSVENRCVVANLREPRADQILVTCQLASALTPPLWRLT